MYLSTLALGACDAVGHVPSLPFAIKVPPLTYLFAEFKPLGDVFSPSHYQS